MLYGIGCDLCSLSHLEKSLSSAHAAAFVRRVYGPAEQSALGLLEASPAPLNAHRLASAAADFAAKEAFLKAAGTGLRAEINSFSQGGYSPQQALSTINAAFLCDPTRENAFGALRRARQTRNYKYNFR